MNIELNESLQQALDAQPNSPLHVVDPRTNKSYVIVAADKFEQLWKLLDLGPLSNEERQVVIQGVWKRAGWDDPRMNDYEALNPRNRT